MKSLRAVYCTYSSFNNSDSCCAGPGATMSFSSHQRKTKSRNKSESKHYWLKKGDTVTTTKKQDRSMATPRCPDPLIMHLVQAHRLPRLCRLLLPRLPPIMAVSTAAKSCPHLLTAMLSVEALAILQARVPMADSVRWIT